MKTLPSIESLVTRGWATLNQRVIMPRMSLGEQGMVLIDDNYSIDSIEGLKHVFQSNIITLVLKRESDGVLIRVYVPSRFKLIIPQ